MATINQMGIPGVGSGVLQPKLKYRWRVTFIGMGGEGSSSQPVSHQAITVNRPTLRFDEYELNRYNTRAYVAGRHEWEPMNVTLEDDVTGSASKIVNEQLQKQQFLIGAEGPFMASAPEGSLYKFATKIEMLDGKEQVIEKWVMQGCFIQNTEWGELDYGSSEAVLINLTLRFDHAFQEIEGYNAGEGIATGGGGQ